VTWATYVPILVFLGLSFYRLRPDVRDRQKSDRRQVALPLLLIPCYYLRAVGRKVLWSSACVCLCVCAHTVTASQRAGLCPPRTQYFIFLYF